MLPAKSVFSTFTRFSRGCIAASLCYTESERKIEQISAGVVVVVVGVEVVVVVAAVVVSAFHFCCFESAKVFLQLGMKQKNQLFQLALWTTPHQPPFPISREIFPFISSASNNYPQVTF